jgi:hypothetical protein
VETNGFWAADEGTVRDRLLALDEAGMGRLTVSCDPYHQQFVPIARVRYLVRLAEEVLGPGRVRVRWRDWAERGFDTDGLSPDRRRAVFGEFAGRGRDRLTGRAAEELAGDLPLTPARAFADNPCKENLLRCRHVHADGAGNIHLGTCAGIVVGKVARPEDARAAWRALSEGYAAMDLVGPLAREGPAAVMELARQRGFQESPRGYASKCHLCWSVRRWLFENGCFPDALCPANVYRP